MPEPDPSELPRCSFCGKDKDHVEKLIAGPNSVYICNECVGLCQAILEGGRTSP